MGLPITFASLANATMSFLDSNFAALGALTPIPCTVTGTNTLVLTPLANTPVVPAYQNYMQFTCVAANTNTSGATAQIVGLSAIDVFKDSPSGPVTLTGGEIVQNVAVSLMYDSTLNTGLGGFHLLSPGSVSGSYLPLSGGTLSGALIGTSAAFVNATISGSIVAGAGTIGTLSVPTIVPTVMTVSTISIGTSASPLLLAQAGTVSFGSITIPALSYAVSTVAVAGLGVSCVVACSNGNTTNANVLVAAQGLVQSPGTVVVVINNLTTVAQTLAANQSIYRYLILET